MISLLLFIAVSQIMAQSIHPQVQIITEPEDTTMQTSISGSAPLKVRFYSGAVNDNAYPAYYEWRFYKNSVKEGETYLVRHEEETEFTFTEVGTHLICLVASFEGSDTVFTEQDYVEKILEPISITISTSKLEFPNAFSPNGDGVNDVYKAKTGFQSIVEFKAIIYNRWGQKIYQWTDPADGWDGTFHGSPVKDGVYFVHVQAKGADGVKYNIRRDVNLLRGYTETSGGGSDN